MYESSDLLGRQPARERCHSIVGVRRLGGANDRHRHPRERRLRARHAARRGHGGHSIDHTPVGFAQSLLRLLAVPVGLGAE